MYRSILNCDNKDPVLCKNLKSKEIQTIKSINVPSFKKGITLLNKPDLVEAPSVKTDCGYVALSNSNECGFDGRQVSHPGPDVGINCKGEYCNPYIATNTTIPVNRPPLQSRKNTTSPDGLPIYNNSLNYNNYSDIKIGNWTYYVDHEISTPYHRPNFVISGQAREQYHTDPMGRTTLQFPVSGLTNNHKEISEIPDLSNEIFIREQANIAGSYKTGNRDDYTKAYYS